MSREINAEIAKTIQLPPTEMIHHALGANHDIRSGLDELVDNAIDAQAKNIRIVFHVDGFRVVQVAVHDDGVGMDAAKMERALRLGGHEASTTGSIGIYGMGLKEGSYANADTVTVVSRLKGQFATGIQLGKASFAAGLLNQRSLTSIWNLRNGLVGLKQGTSIIWTNLTEVYQGDDETEGFVFLANTIEKIRKHFGIRYHRFLDSGRVTIKIFTIYDDFDPVANPAIEPIDPCGYRKSGDKGYPKRLTIDGEGSSLGITAHIWTNKSKTDQFLLEGRDELGHQGFYVYVADRLITQGGWSGFQEPRKDLKLLRVVIEDPRVVEKYITISPQKGSVRFTEDFHRFADSLRSTDPSRLTFEDVCDDALETLRFSNRRSGNASPIAEGGRGLAASVRGAIEDLAPLKSSDPVDVIWAELNDDEFVRVDPTVSTIFINKKYRKMLNPGRGGLNDVPLVKTLVYLLFNGVATSKRTSKNRSNTELWSQILSVAAEEEFSKWEAANRSS